LIGILRDRSRPQCADISGSYVRFISWQESGEIHGVPNMVSLLPVCRYELLESHSPWNVNMISPFILLIHYQA
jgi:hypothetical protein